MTYSFQPGQFCMLSIPHCGEVAISISSSPDTLPFFDLSIRNAGVLTNAIHQMQAGDQAGDQMGIRGSFGTPFSMDAFADSDLLIVAGCIGLAPFKSAIDHARFHSSLEDSSTRSITLLYRSRNPEEVAFTSAITTWEKQGIDCKLIVDEGDGNWQGEVGMVTDLLQKVELTDTSKVLVCGPPIMIRFVIAQLVEKDFKSRDIFTTLERHMKCGMGICGHCHFDGKLVCMDGPVFSLKQLETMQDAI